MQVYDVAVVGCGPAGLSAALNAKNRGKSVILHGVEFCSQALHRAPEIRNYLGFPNVTGPELRQTFLDHAKAAGIEITKGKVSGVMPMGDKFTLVTATDFFEARSVVLATGVAPAKYLDGEKDLLGRGVSYCATCDGPLYRDKRVIVIGQGLEATEEAHFLAELAAKVSWIGKDEEAPQGANVAKSPGVPVGVSADSGELVVHLKDGTLVRGDGVFILRETTPAEQLLQGLTMADGVVKVGANFATNIPGVFAAGDCAGRPYQLAKAVGEGQVAALGAVKYVDGLAAKTAAAAGEAK